MSADDVSPTALSCPNCGGRLVGFPPDDDCAGVRCSSCDYVGAVTTNPNRPSFDPTPYDVWVDAADGDRRSVIAAVANVMCIGVLEARRMMDTGLPVARGVNALEVQRLARMLGGAGLRVRIHPPFPWPLE